MTILYLYYNQPEAIQFLEAQEYEGINFLFVDDGSKEPLKTDLGNVIRIDKDIPWNMSQANNIGLKSLAPDEIVVRMDIDHYFTLEELKQLSDIKPKKNEVIHFKRHPLKTPPNIFMARVGDLLDAGGYDEDFCGNYGYEDKELMYRLAKKGFVFSLSNINVKVNKYSTKELSRNLSVNRKKLNIKTKQ